MDATAIGYDTQHCWAVKGKNNAGRFILRRYVPGREGIRSLSHAASAAATTAQTINDYGGSVQVFKQHMDINNLWQNSND